MTNKVLKRALEMAVKAIGNNECDYCPAELMCPINEGQGMPLSKCVKVIKSYFIRKAKEELK